MPLGTGIEDLDGLQSLSLGEACQFRCGKGLIGSFSVHYRCDLHEVLDNGVFEGEKIDGRTDIEEVAPGYLFHYLDDGDCILDFPIQSLEKVYALIFQDFPETPLRSADLEDTTYDEKEDDEGADEGKKG